MARHNRQRFDLPHDEQVGQGTQHAQPARNAEREWERLRAAVANVASAEAALRTAEANWGRIEPLRARGVEPEEAGLWDDYRVGALSGYFMAVFASMNVERTERGDEMFAVMAERPARQAIALGSLDLL